MDFISCNFWIIIFKSQPASFESASLSAATTVGNCLCWNNLTTRVNNNNGTQQTTTEEQTQQRETQQHTTQTQRAAHSSTDTEREQIRFNYVSVNILYILLLEYYIYIIYTPCTPHHYNYNIYIHCIYKY